jgi:integrase
VRGHVFSRGEVSQKTGKPEGPPWAYVIELGEQPAQRCPVCVDKRGRHSLHWLEGKPLAECPTCGGELETVRERRQRTRGGFKLRKEADKAYRDEVGDREDGTYTEPSNITLSEYLTVRWLPVVETTKKPSTYSSYQHHVTAYLVPELGHLRLRDLDAGHINALYGELQTGERGRQGKGLSGGTVRRVHTTLRKALADAVKWRLVPFNAAADADPPSADAGAETMNVWTEAQLGAFLEAVGDDRLFAMWRLFAMTGMRRGEVCGLQWKHVDAERSRVEVKQARVNVGYEVILGTPKTKNGQRGVSLDAGTLAALQAWRDTQDLELMVLDAKSRAETYLFTDKGGTPLHPDRVTKLFDKHQAAVRTAQKKADADAETLPRIRLHDLRHTHATLGALNGVPPKAMAERLGQDVVTYMQTYVHNLPGMQDNAAALIAARVDAG